MAEVEKKEHVKKPPVRLRSLYDDVAFLMQEIKNLREYVRRIEDEKKNKPLFLKEIEAIKTAGPTRKRRRRIQKEVDPVMAAVKQGLKDETEDIDEKEEFGIPPTDTFTDDDDFPEVEKPKRRGRPKGSKNKK